MKAPTAFRILTVACLAVLLSACNQDDPHNPYTSDLIGLWGIDNDGIRQADEMPVMKQLWVYTTQIKYSAGSGMVAKQGQWRDDGFWCQNANGSGEVEVAKIKGPEELEFHLSVFDPSSPEVDILYKERGSNAEMQALAAEYPPPITYPPPAGVIKFGMTEYRLKNLPWQPYQMSPTGDEPYSRGTLYSYHSDKPGVDDLTVTVKNHTVILVKGGNE